MTRRERLGRHLSLHWDRYALKLALLASAVVGAVTPGQVLDLTTPAGTAGVWLWAGMLGVGALLGIVGLALSSVLLERISLPLCATTVAAYGVGLLWTDVVSDAVGLLVVALAVALTGRWVHVGDGSITRKANFAVVEAAVRLGLHRPEQ